MIVDDSLELARRCYEVMDERVAAGRSRFGRPLTLTEKILVSHLKVDEDHPYRRPIERGRSYVALCPDRVAMQDATAQMALLQFMIAGMDRVQVPTTVHCDHLITAREGAAPDLASALDVNREVYDFLRTASARYGIGFWQPGSGIIHQVVLENYSFPGGLMVGTDSHTPNAGGLGMVAVGVGGADAVDVMAGTALDLLWPRLIGVRLTGQLSGWSASKDIILELARVLTVAGGTGAIIEYIGPGVATISATGRATITNMGAEVGATTSLFPFDERTATYLAATGRSELAEAAAAVAPHLRADDEVLADPGRFYDRVIEIDLSTLEPQVAGPHTPDRVRPVSRLGEEARANGWPARISYALVGSCTNSSYEDISRAASVARQAAAAGLKARVPLLVTPGSEKVRATIERDGLLADLEAVGAAVLANACGPCIGQWSRSDVGGDETNTIVTSYNRNFPKRNDGNAKTLAFVASPETTVALALAGTLEFDPRRQAIDGTTLPVPTGEELPSRGFADGAAGYLAPSPDPSVVEVVIDPTSTRLERLEPFPPWDGFDEVRLAVLVKAQGKCTTDHISAAGRWLRYRGHLSNISANLFLGAVDAFTGETGRGWCRVHETREPLPEIARHYRDAGIAWAAVGDHNYGEGSSREHAAMEPRFLGARAVIARSFARIHETNLKRQGVLALTFADPATYDEIGRDDDITVTGLSQLAPGRPVTCRLQRPDGSAMEFLCTHTLSEEHVAWFRAGSALNLFNQRHAAEASGRRG